MRKWAELLGSGLCVLTLIHMDDARRKSKRLPASLQVYWERLGAGKQLVQIADISVGGCFIKSSTPPEKGAVVLLEMRLPTGRWLLLDGNVAHLKPGEGFGVKFTADLEDDVLKAINPSLARGPS